MGANAQPLLNPPDAAPRDKRTTVLACFFAVGAGSCITFNSVVMAVAYFREFLGEGVLAKLALAHNSALLLSMGSLIVAASKNPSLAVYQIVLRGSLLFAVGFDAVVLQAAWRRQPIHEAPLLVAVALNGVATGLVQGLGASLGGLFDPYSFYKGCGAMQLSGAAFGVLVPTLTQLALIPIAARARTSEELKDASRLGAVVSCAIAAAVGLSATVAVGVLKSTQIWHAVAEQCLAGIENECGPRPPAGSEARINPAVDTIGKCINTGSKRVLWTRLHQMSMVMVAQVVIEFSFVALLLMAPALPVRGGSFWQHFLATACLIVANVGSFAGRMTATTSGLGEPSGLARFGRHGRTVLLSALVGFAPIPAVAIHVYKHAALSGGGALSAWWLLACFALASTVIGFTLISLMQLSQRLCNHSMATPCEITAQFIWISLNVGALGGTVLALAMAHGH